MGDPLWAPWRIDYILGKKPDTCIFCGIREASEKESTERLVVFRNEHCFVMLNRYPFAAGHLLVVPYAHVGELGGLSSEVHSALFDLIRISVGHLRSAVKAEGFNVGLNLGEAAGAGFAEHLHAHIVPRWTGDTNFMPVVADTRVVPQALAETAAYLRTFFSASLS